MAVEIFLDLGDEIKGESQKAKAEGLIEIFSFSNGASNPSSVSMGTGSGSGKVDVSSLSLQKQLDKASPLLFLACCKGTHIAKGTMTVREAGGDKEPQIYYQYDMNELFVDSISWGAAAGGGKPSESLSLSCKSLQITYWPQNPDGGPGDKVPAGWDVSLNQESTQ
jgi:type VI secretion system secreted protein Hcp